MEKAEIEALVLAKRLATFDQLNKACDAWDLDMQVLGSFLSHGIDYFGIYKEKDQVMIVFVDRPFHARSVVQEVRYDFLVKLHEFDKKAHKEAEAMMENQFYVFHEYGGCEHVGVIEKGKETEVNQKILDKAKDG